MLPSHNSWRTAKVNGPALNLPLFVSSIVTPLLSSGLPESSRHSPKLEVARDLDISPSRQGDSSWPEFQSLHLVGKGDIRAQTRQIFEQIKMIVETGGGKMDVRARWC